VQGHLANQALLSTSFHLAFAWFWSRSWRYEILRACLHTSTAYFRSLRERRCATFKCSRGMYAMLLELRCSLQLSSKASGDS
jgi:hypothetical protein